MNYVNMKYGWHNIAPGILELGTIGTLSMYNLVWVLLCQGSFPLSFMFD